MISRTYNVEQICFRSEQPSLKVEFKQKHINIITSENIIIHNEENSRKTDADIVKNDKKQEEVGIILLKRNAKENVADDEVVDILAAMVPTSQHKDPEVVQAKIDELNKWKSYEAYEEVEDEGQEAIDTRWTVTRKEAHDGLKTNVKAWLCAIGFKENVDGRRTFNDLGSDAWN